MPSVPCSPNPAQPCWCPQPRGSSGASRCLLAPLAGMPSDSVAGPGLDPPHRASISDVWGVTCCVHVRTSPVGHLFPALSQWLGLGQARIVLLGLCWRKWRTKASDVCPVLPPAPLPLSPSPPPKI